jgi:carbonic anhydrase
VTAFDDLLASNQTYAETFADADLAPIAARGVAVLTCMDSRIDPLRTLGLDKGDAKILRNAGGRVTDDVLRTLVLASHLLGVTRVLLMPHTKCRMSQGTEDDIHRVILERSGIDTRSLEFRTDTDQIAALRTDLTRVRAFPLFPQGLAVGGAMYDVDTGLVTPVDLG